MSQDAEAMEMTTNEIKILEMKSIEMKTLQMNAKDIKDNENNTTHIKLPIPSQDQPNHIRPKNSTLTATEAKVAIVDYGAGNVKSVTFACEQLGKTPLLTSDERQLRDADFVIFPGVGHARSAMQALRNKGLDQVIPTLEQPVLGICLGMQLMCTHSEEGDTPGLGIFDAVVKRFQVHSSLKVPHMGWNDLLEGKGLLQGIDQPVYFVHSYFASVCEDTIAKSTYGVQFSAALGRNNFVGCQFHPEKSGVAGSILLQRFFEGFEGS